MSNDKLDDLLEQYAIAFIVDDNAPSSRETERTHRDLVEAKQAIQAYCYQQVMENEKRANYLNDALRRSAEFMLENNLLPPDTATVDGIKSYFLNESRFNEQKAHQQFNIGDIDE